MQRVSISWYILIALLMTLTPRRDEHATPEKKSHTKATMEKSIVIQEILKHRLKCSPESMPSSVFPLKKVKKIK